MGAGITLVLVVLIICLSVLFGYYMENCSDYGIKMFTTPKYEERITKLEKQVKELKEKDK